MTTIDFIKSVELLGYKLNWSYKNANNSKVKLLITHKDEKHPSAWVFVHEPYSFRSLGVTSELFTLLVMYASTSIYDRGVV